MNQRQHARGPDELVGEDIRQLESRCAQQADQRLCSRFEPNRDIDVGRQPRTSPDDHRLRAEEIPANALRLQHRGERAQ